MSNLVKFGGGGMPADPSALEKGLANIQQNMGPQTGGTPFLRLGKDGIWVYGQENVEVEEDSTWAINPFSMQHGWAAWGDGELFDEVMVPMTQTPPPKNELQNYGVEWKTQLALVLMCLSGEDKGQTVLYKGTSIGMQNAVRELNAAIINRLSVDKENFVPVVSLDVDSYQHKKHGKTYVPILEIVDWVSMEGGSAEPSTEGDDLEKEPPFDPDEATVAAEAGKAQGDDEPPEQAEKADPEEKPTRRRRRRRG